MTKENKEFLTGQLHIIQGKQTEEELAKYSTLLHEAKIPGSLKEYLYRGVEVRRKELAGGTDALVVSSDFD